jgi:hypothetical protein
MPRWSIETATNAVIDAVQYVNEDDNDPALVEAKLADHYRDAGVLPLIPEIFAAQTGALSKADWLRLEIIVDMFDNEDLHKALTEISTNTPVEIQISIGILPIVKTLQAINETVLATSMVRAEELARRVAAGLRIAFEGESEKESAKRLAKIDYTRLLEKVDAAKASAEEQLAELLKHQEEADARIRRRGKW